MNRRRQNMRKNRRRQNMRKNRRRQNMRKNRRQKIKQQNSEARQKHKQKRQEAPSALDLAIGEALLGFCASVAFGGFREHTPSERKKVHKQLQGAKQNEIELEPGVYLSHD